MYVTIPYKKIPKVVTNRSKKKKTSVHQQPPLRSIKRKRLKIYEKIKNTFFLAKHAQTITLVESPLKKTKENNATEA